MQVMDDENVKVPTLPSVPTAADQAKEVIREWCKLMEEKHGERWPEIVAREMGEETAEAVKGFYSRSASRVKIPDATAESGSRDETLIEREARRLDERLPPGYRPTSASDLTFDPRIAYEIALGLDKASTIFGKYNVSPERAEALIKNSVFLGTIKRYQEEVQSSGISFKLKAKIQAEDLLTHSYLIATDPEVPYSVRADLIKWTAKVAGLEPTDKNAGAGGAAGGFTLNITLAEATPAATGRTITITPSKEDEE